MNNNQENGKWEAPKTEPAEKELMRNIPELEGIGNKYIYHEGYVYYITTQEKDTRSSVSERTLKRARCDGKEIITLYSCKGMNYSGPDSEASHSLFINSISDNYVYFTESYYSQNDWYISEEQRKDYKIKTDGSGELILLREVKKSNARTEEREIYYEYDIERGVVIDLKDE